MTMVIHAFCKICEHEIVLQDWKSKQKQFHGLKSYKTRESTLSWIGNFEENIDLSRIHLAVPYCPGYNRSIKRGPKISSYCAGFACKAWISLICLPLSTSNLVLLLHMLEGDKNLRFFNIVHTRNELKTAFHHRAIFSWNEIGHTPLLQHCKN